LDKEAVRANNASDTFTRRAEVRIEASPQGDSFVVAWTSWAQDGAGWGVYARFFGVDGVPLGEEQQVNTIWAGFQWRPQVVWCMDSVWAIYLNSTGQDCLTSSSPSSCATGPFLRRLKKPGEQTEHPPETNMRGHRPLLAALSCDKFIDSPKYKPDGSIVYWLEHVGDSVRWEYSEDQQASLVVAGDTSSPTQLEELPRVELAWLHRAWAWISTIRLSDITKPVSFATLQEDWAFVVEGRVAAISNLDSYGNLQVRILTFNTMGQATVYRPQQVHSAVSAPRLAWDKNPSDNVAKTALWTCFATGSDVSEEDLLYKCSRTDVDTLVQGFGHAASWGVTILFFLIYFAVLLGCFRLRVGDRTAWGRRGVRRRLRFADRRRRNRLALPEEFEVNEMEMEVNDVMADLRNLPSSPSRQTQSEDGDSSPTSDGSPRSGPPECVICQNDVAVPVALRPCGHTACKDCVKRLIETSGRCHMCRQRFTGVQAVYL